MLAARTAVQVDQAAAELGCEGMTADLGEPAAAEHLVAGTIAAFGRIDGALISVGGPPPGTAMDLTDSQWAGAFDTIFLGALRVCRAVVAALPSSGGSLALVLSSSAKSPIPGLAASNGLRPGLAMLAKTMADELGHRNIRVNALLPGRIDTDRVRELDGPDPATRLAHEHAIPLGRYGVPAEFGRAAAFVLSPAASYLSGAMIPVDGGALRSL